MMSLRFPLAGMPIAATLLLATPSLSFAAGPTAPPPPPPKLVKFVVGTGLTFGGDELADVEVEDYYGDEETRDISAGGLFHLYGGLNIELPRTDFSIQTTIGYHFDGVFAKDGSVTFTRYPFEIIPYYNFDRIRFGIGLSYHLNPRFNGDDDAALGDREYDDELGFVASIEYKIGSRFAVGLHYTKIEYELDSIDPRSGDFASEIDTEVDGSNVGIYGSFLF